MDVLEIPSILVIIIPKFICTGKTKSDEIRQMGAFSSHMSAINAFTRLFFLNYAQK